MVNDVEIVVDPLGARDKGWAVQTGLIGPGFDSSLNFDMGVDTSGAGMSFGLDSDTSWKD